jgi:hypothetical protein
MEGTIIVPKGDIMKLEEAISRYNSDSLDFNPALVDDMLVFTTTELTDLCTMINSEILYLRAQDHFDLNKYINLFLTKSMPKIISKYNIHSTSMGSTVNTINLETKVAFIFSLIKELE